MEVRLTIEGGADEAEEYASLVGWLDANRDFRGRTRVERRPGAEGGLGSEIIEAITAIVGGRVGVRLADSLNLWLRTRRPGVTLTVTRPADDITVSVKVEHSSDVQAVLREALRGPDE
jgi:membrane-associated two-gene conflict system component 1 (EACC1)